MHDNHAKPEEGDVRVTLCQRLMFCACANSPKGQLAYAFHCNLVKWLKPFLVVSQPRKQVEEAEGARVKAKAKPKKTPTRKLMESAQIVLRLQQLDAEPEAQAPAIASGPSRGWQKAAQEKALVQAPMAYAEEYGEPESQWVHVGFMNYKSFNFTIQPLLYGPSEGTVNLIARSPVSFYRSFEYFEKLNLDLPCVASCYTIQGTPLPCAVSEMSPNAITVIPYAPVKPTSIWLGAQRERQNTRESKKRKRGAAQKRPRGQAKKQTRTRSKKTIQDLEHAEDSDGSQDVMPLPDLASDSELGEDDFAEAPEDMPGASDLEAQQDFLEVDLPKETPEAPSRSGAAGSSEQAPEAEAPAEPRPPLVFTRGQPDLVFYVGRGQITYYAKQQNLVAYCRCPSHGDCRRSRTVKASTVGSRKAQGRPIGALAAWIEEGHEYATGEEHKTLSFPAQDARRRAREACKAARGYAALTAHERPKRDGEGSEPEGLA